MKLCILTIAFFLINSSHGHITKIKDQKAGCTINLRRDIDYKQALLLNPSTKDFLLPGDRDLQIEANGVIYLACPGEKNYINTDGKPTELEVRCVSGTNFASNNGPAKPLRNYACVDYPQSIARKTGKKCSGSFTEIEIGFSISKGFVRQLTTCMDESKSDTLYSVYTIPASIRQQQINIPRPDDGFQEGNFYPGLNVNGLYSKNNQRAKLAQLLKSNALAEKYIKLDDDYFYMARGHLAAKADFIYGSQQRATFYLINVAPQWQIFNSGNWEQLEIDSRDFASSRKLDLSAITGVWGTSTLPDINNNPTALYLYLNRNGPNKLTVPATFWKVLYDPKSLKGVAFVGHNNPYENNVKPICTNVCNQIKWLKWQPTNVTLGYSYCCEVDDLRKKVTYLPSLRVTVLIFLVLLLCWFLRPEGCFCVMFDEKRTTEDFSDKHPVEPVCPALA